MLTTSDGKAVERERDPQGAWGKRDDAGWNPRADVFTISRGTAAVRLARAGCNEVEIYSITGQQARADARDHRQQHHLPRDAEVAGQRDRRNRNALQTSSRGIKRGTKLPRLSLPTAPEGGDRENGESVARSIGWGARTRTWEWRNQNPLPYHLATPQQAARCHHGARTIAARLGPINGRRQSRRALDGPGPGERSVQLIAIVPHRRTLTLTRVGTPRDGNSAVIAPVRAATLIGGGAVTPPAAFLSQRLQISFCSRLHHRHRQDLLAVFDRTAT